MRNITPVSTPAPETKFNGRAIGFATARSAIADAAAHYQTMVRFVQSQMQRDIDYGTVPGIQKPILFKAGAEKLCKRAIRLGQSGL